MNEDERQDAQDEAPEKINETEEMPTETPAEMPEETVTETSADAPADDAPAEDAPAEDAPEATYAFRWDYTEQDRRRAERAEEKRRRGLRTYAIVVSIAFLLCFALLAAILLIDDITTVNKVIHTEKTIYVREYDAESGVLTIPEIADKVKPSVVGIKITTGSGMGIGTGIILSEDGYIATNSHVVEKAGDITVILLDGTEYEARVIGRDALSDLAVVKVEATDLPEATFGDSDALIVGEMAVAIGTPAGLELAGTVTSGIISAINRDVKIYNQTTGALEKTMTLIQTSANINPGNSGGPLINDHGEVIGINTLRLADGYDGIGFAIPITAARQILDMIIAENGDISENQTGVAEKRAVIGIRGRAVVKGQGYAMEDGTLYLAPESGVYVAEATEGFDAAEKLCAGDLIVGINGSPVLTINDISSVINEKKPGDTVDLTVYRDGHLIYVTVILDYEA